MRTIKVSGGYSDYAVARLTEARRQPLTDSDIRMVLVAQGEDVPPRTDPSWVPADVTEFISPHDVRCSLLVTDSVALGLYVLWTLAIDNPTATPVKATNHLVAVT